MVTIRLKRVGAKNRASYRIVVMEKRSKNLGKSIAEIGFYNPLVKPPIININRQELEKWLNNGAQISPAVKKLPNS